MATAATIKKNIAKLEAALKSKATPKSLKSKLETQLVKSKAELSGLNKGSKPKTSSAKSTQTALQKLKEMVNKNKKLKTYKKSGVDLEKDADRPALPIGRRTAKASGKTYYEYRANRIDVKQPPKRYPKLEKGGKLYNEQYGVGSSKYVVNYHDGIKTNKDGSPFYDIKIFKNKVEKDEFVSKLVNDGYKEKMAKGGYMAKGGIAPSKTKIIDFYINAYPSDELGVDINPKATFYGLNKILNSKSDVYEYIGVGDSLVRERIFIELANQMKVPYDVIYDKWVNSDDIDLDSFKEWEKDKGYDKRMAPEYVNPNYMAKGGSLSSIKEEYEENEDNNAHSENVVLLAKHFGTKEDLVEAKRILDLHEKEGHLTSENGKKRQQLHLKLIEKARTAMDKEGIEFAKGGYVAVSEKDGYWYIMSKPTTKEYAEEAISLGVPRGEVGKVVTLKEAKEHKKVIGAEYLEKGGYMAKGGLTEHGLKIGDTIISKGIYTIKVSNKETGFATVDLNKGERVEMKAMGGEMHRTQE